MSSEGLTILSAAQAHVACHQTLEYRLIQYLWHRKLQLDHSGARGVDYRSAKSANSSSSEQAQGTTVEKRFENEIGGHQEVHSKESRLH